MRFPAAALVCLFGFACESKDAAESSVDAAVARPTPAGLRLDDAPLEAKTRLALGIEGESSLRIRVSTVAEQCAELRAGDPSVPSGETAVDFWVAPMFQPDGSTRWGFHSAFVTRPERHSGVVRAALLDDVATTDASVTLKKFDIRLHEPFGLIAYEGDLTATRCPPVKRSELPLEQPDLKLTIAGRPVTVAGATLSRREDQLYLKLTKTPHDCATERWDGYDLVLDVVARGAPLEVAFGALGGTAFEGSKAGSEGAGKMKLRIDESSDTGVDAGAPIRTVEVDGTLDLEGFETTLHGSVRALDCR